MLPGSEALIVALVAALLLGFYLLVYPLRGYSFPIGADSPVYLWWTRLAGHDGLSAVRTRPGVPALALLLRGTLGLSDVQSIAVIGPALAAAAGLGAGSLAVLAGTGDRRRRGTWALASLLAGAFAAPLADGYLASLCFAAVFLAACALLTTGLRPATAGATALLSAGSLLHPAFFLLGAVILGAATLPRVLRPAPEPSLVSSEPGRIFAAIAGAALLGTAALAALRIGAQPLVTVTSFDGFLRHAGLTELLHHLYRERLVLHWHVYLLPVSVPLAALGVRRLVGSGRRLILAWTLVTIVGIAVSWASGLVPAERLLSFAFVLPILAGLGIMVLWRAGVRSSDGHALTLETRAAAVLLLGVLCAGAVLAWSEARPYANPPTLEATHDAARVVAATARGRQVVFLVDNKHDPAFAVARGNLLRASVQPWRIRDVHLYVGKPSLYLERRPTITGAPVHDALSRRYTRLLPPRGSHPLALLLLPLASRWEGDAIRRGREILPGVYAFGAAPRPLETTSDVISTSPPWMLVLAGVGAFVLLALAGYGWSRSTLGDRLHALALAPAFGAATLILGTVLLERLGLPLSGVGAPLISGLVGGGGYLLAARLRGNERSLRL